MEGSTRLPHLLAIQILEQCSNGIFHQPTQDKVQLSTPRHFPQDVPKEFSLGSSCFRFRPVTLSLTRHRRALFTIRTKRILVSNVDDIRISRGSEDRYRKRASEIGSEPSAFVVCANQADDVPEQADPRGSSRVGKHHESQDYWTRCGPETVSKRKELSRYRQVRFRPRKFASKYCLGVH